MHRLILIILLAVFISIPSWARHEYVNTSSIEFDRGYELLSSLDVDVNDTDTVWSLQFIGRYLDENTILLIKTGDGKVIEYTPSHYHAMQMIDSLTTSPLTGELIDHWHYEHVLTYELSPYALHYFMQHGIAKIRIGSETSWKEKVWKRNEWGKRITEAYHELTKRLAPDYTPPKKPTIRDGF